uniref:Dehydrogenase/reductase X-linked n=1 Tax=Canis lupus familiaris TaxID=9615 RepID=A0A8C0MZ48_CANLF
MHVILVMSLTYETLFAFLLNSTTTGAISLPVFTESWIRKWEIPTGNNDSSAPDVVRKIQEETLNDKVEFLYCDLASLRSIRQFVQKFKKKKIPLHVLVNNAGVMMVPERTTEDGFEEHFGLNYLGHFLLTNLLLDTLKESGAPGRCARVVTVSSATHYIGELDMDDLQGSRCYSPHAAYAQSKLALVLFTYHLQRLLAAQGSPVTANVVDPGVVNTNLYRHVFWGTRLIKKLFGWWFFKVADGVSLIPWRTLHMCAPDGKIRTLLLLYGESHLTHRTWGWCEPKAQRPTPVPSVLMESWRIRPCKTPEISRAQGDTASGEAAGLHWSLQIFCAFPGIAALRNKKAVSKKSFYEGRHSPCPRRVLQP